MLKYGMEVSFFDIGIRPKVLELKAERPKLKGKRFWLEAMLLQMKKSKSLLPGA
jgi:hypothetical protein